MHTFALEKIDSIKGKQTAEQLFVDGVGQLDSFEKDLIGTTYQGEFNTLLTYMEYICNNNSLPKTKFREIKPSSTPKEYELKSKHLRLYMIQKPGGKIIIFGGYKTNQANDIGKFKSLKKQYLKSL